MKISIVLKSFEVPSLKIERKENRSSTAGAFISSSLHPHSEALRVKKKKVFGSSIFQTSSLHSIRLPKTQSLYTVLRSPHIDKKSREQFEMKIHKQLIIIKTEMEQLREKLFHLKFHDMSGVQMKVIFQYKTRLSSLI